MGEVEVDNYCVYRDPDAAVEARIKDLLSRMKLKEKVGQMTMIERRVATHDAIRDLSIGTVSLSLSPSSVWKLLTVTCICPSGHITFL